MNIAYLNSSLKYIIHRRKYKKIFALIEKGVVKLLLYGAGEIVEILLQTIELDRDIPIKIVGYLMR